MPEDFNYSWDWEDDGTASGRITCVCGNEFDGIVSNVNDKLAECPTCHRKYKGKWLGMGLELVK